MKTFRTTVSFLLVCFSSSFAQYANLSISSPRGNTPAFTGTIEDAVAVVAPQGGHANIDLYLTFSTKASNIVNDDSLEVRCWFSLPSQSFITDLWLWIGDDTSRALIADRFKAQATYNTIVGARKDPALLMKEGSDSYSLSIFPITLPGKRKVKISYTTPISVLDSIGKIPVPIWLLKASAPFNGKPFTIFVTPNSSWKDPYINGGDVFPLQQVTDTTFGVILRGDVHRDSLEKMSTLDIVLLRSATGVSWYAEKYHQGNGGTYRIAFEPFTNLDIYTGKKVLVLVDYDSLNVNPAMTKNILLNEIMTGLLAYAAKEDSFNIVFSAKGKPVVLNPTWLPSTAQSIDAAVNNLNLSSVLDTVDLAGVLQTGFQYAKGSGLVHGILIVASSDQYDDIAKANHLFDSLVPFIPSKTKIFSVDFNDSAKYYYWPNWYYTYGNSYLYQRFADRTGGRSIKVYSYYGDSPIDYYIGNYYQQIKWSIEYFDVNIHLTSGFTYQNFSSVNSYNRTNLFANTMVTQVGKFIGDFPMYIDITGMYGGVLHTKRIVINDSDFTPSDSSLNKVWANQLLSEYSQYYYQRNEQAIELSIENRILSYWTAFLALEPGQKLCDTCIVPGGGIIVTEIKTDPLLPNSHDVLRAYPNPFNPTTTVLVSIPDGVERKTATAAIYNVLGQKIRTIDLQGVSDRGEGRFVWNATDDNGRVVSSGVYFLVLTTSHKRYMHKLMLLK